MHTFINQTIKCPIKFKNKWLQLPEAFWLGRLYQTITFRTYDLLDLIKNKMSIKNYIVNLLSWQWVLSAYYLLFILIVFTIKPIIRFAKFTITFFTVNTIKNQWFIVEHKIHVVPYLKYKGRTLHYGWPLLLVGSWKAGYNGSLVYILYVTINYFIRKTILSEV